MYYAGIDAGAINTAVVILDGDRIILQKVVNSLTDDPDPLRIMNAALEEAGLEGEEIDGIVATGRGRGICLFANKQSPEVICQARGALYFLPTARTIINLGAENSRIICLNDSGKVKAFAANDKCAAGSGLFLDSMADLMGIPVSEMGGLALNAPSAEGVSSRCAVFAESEVISHIHRGVPKERILAGLHLAVTDRIMELSQKVTIEPALMVTGGVARNRAIIKDIEMKLGLSVYIPPGPQIVGALGAALLAQDQAGS
ncbi:MAG: 2-hydroxyglutaryl-CoA dehydratase [Deltaproteobacteria bacterium]|nr:2-hydroxyglutaryl-CoA dehydratase [Deltaproteobacteria bacterium]